MEQENLLRSLMNVRMPMPVSEEFLKVQDEYLKQRNEERGITDIRDLKPVMTDNRLYIWQGDITTFSTVKAFLDKDSRIEKVIFNVLRMKI